MTISIVLPTRNRCHVLGRTLPTVLAQDYPADRYEIIVVIDGGTDGTAAMLATLRPRCAFRVIEQAHGGQAAAINAGVAMARHELVLLLDDDLICAPDLLAEHVAAHGDSRARVVSGAVLISDESVASAATALARRAHDTETSRFARPRSPKWWEAYVHANCSLPTQLLRTAGGFDAQLGRLFDADLGLRLSAQGVAFHYRPTALTRQICTKSIRQFLATEAVDQAASLHRLCRRHPTFRPHSEFARQPSTLARRLVAAAATRAPRGLDRVLAPLGWLADRLPAAPWTTALAARLLQLRRAIVLRQEGCRAAGGWGTWQRDFGARLPVLMYHHVGPPRPDVHPALTVSPARFRDQMRWLGRHGYVGITAADWQAWRVAGRPLPARPVLITFDDGFRDLVAHALPVLQEHGFGAVIFVVSDEIGGVNRWDGVLGYGTQDLMTAAELRAAADAGIEIGGHSRSHAELPAQPADALADELDGCRDRLTALLGRPITTFAYPYGLFDSTVEAAVDARFALAFSIEEGLNDLATPSYRQRRTMVRSNDTLLDLRLRVQLGWSPLQSVRATLRLGSRWRKLRSWIDPGAGTTHSAES
jgi:peptidoglycan/xylan/chitin deacetylase (PgdA/CDA1 family)/GT2 family glycosyltransferase